MAEKRRTHSDRIEALEDAFTQLHKYKADLAEQNADVAHYETIAQSVLDAMNGLNNRFEQTILALDQAKLVIANQTMRIGELEQAIENLQVDADEQRIRGNRAIHADTDLRLEIRDGYLRTVAILKVLRIDLVSRGIDVEAIDIEIRRLDQLTTPYF